MSDLKDRIARFRELREKATDGTWLEKASDSSTFEYAIIAGGLDLLSDCQKRIEELEQQLVVSQRAVWRTRRY